MNCTKTYSVKLDYLVVISAIVIVTYCAPLPKDSEAQVSSYNYTNDGRGNYYFRFGATNGIIREETGTVVNKGLPNEHITVKGAYSFINSDGLPVYYTYTADENGFVITPEIPENEFNRIGGEVVASLLGK